ncbi:MAG: ABC transporter permease [Hyphomicrobiales bacterium]
MAPWVWLAGPYALVLFLFLAIPLCNLVVLSLFRYSATSIWTPELTASNYARILDGFYIALTLRSLWIGAITTALCVVLGYPLAYFLARCSPRALSLGLFLLVLPLMVSTVIRAFGWIILLGREGAINSLLRALGIGEPLGMLYSEGSVIVALVQYVLPLMVLPLMAAIERIPLSLEEAAVNLGSSAATVFRRLIFPLSLPGLVSGILLSFTVSISVVVTPALLGGRKVRMFGNEIYDQVVTANNWPFASSLAVMMILLTFLAIALGLAAGARAGRRR